MPETELSTQTKEAIETPKIASVGKVERVPINIQNISQQSENNVDEIDLKETLDSSTEQKPPITETELTEDQLKLYFEKQGIKYTGIEQLKEKLNYIPTAEPTQEQKAEQAKIKEKRLLDKFIEGGGTAETYVAIKGVAAADANQFSINMAKESLMKGGYTPEEAETFIKNELFQIDDAELEQWEDETEKAYKKRTKEFFAKQLAANSNPHIEKAKWVLQNLNEAIESEDLQRQNEIAISAKIDEDFKALPRKLTFEIGDIGGTTTAPVDYDVSETDLAEVKAMMKDPVQFKQFLYNQDGSLNTTNLTNVLTRNKILESASKISFLTGMTKGINDALKNFKGSPQELGVGGIPTKPTGQKGQPASYGKVQRVQPQRQ